MEWAFKHLKPETHQSDTKELVVMKADGCVDVWPDVACVWARMLHVITAQRLQPVANQHLCSY